MDLQIFLIAILILALAFPIGNFLAKFTKDELKQGQKYFRIIIMAGFLCSIISLIIRNDYLLFSFLFIAIVTSRSLR